MILLSNKQNNYSTKSLRRGQFGDRTFCLLFWKESFPRERFNVLKHSCGNFAGSAAYNVVNSWQYLTSGVFLSLSWFVLCMWLIWNFIYINCFFPFLISHVQQNASAEKENLQVDSRKEENQSIQECGSQDVSLAHLEAGSNLDCTTWAP